jgi:hypothetical protein
MTWCSAPISCPTASRPRSAGGRGDLFPGRGGLFGGLFAAAVAQREQPLAALLLAGDPALVLQHLEGGVDRAGAGTPDAAGALVELLDHLVPVHGPLGEEGQQGGADVAAPGAPAAAAASPPAVVAAEAGPAAPGAERVAAAEALLRGDESCVSHRVLLVHLIGCDALTIYRRTLAMQLLIHDEV